MATRVLSDTLRYGIFKKGSATDLSNNKYSDPNASLQFPILFFIQILKAQGQLMTKFLKSICSLLKA